MLPSGHLEGVGGIGGPGSAGPPVQATMAQELGGTGGPAGGGGWIGGGGGGGVVGGYTGGIVGGGWTAGGAQGGFTWGGVAGVLVTMGTPTNEGEAVLMVDVWINKPKSSRSGNGKHESPDPHARKKAVRNSCSAAPFKTTA